MLTLLPMIAGTPPTGAFLERLEPCEGKLSRTVGGVSGRPLAPTRCIPLMVQRTYKLAALFFFILGLSCIIDAVVMFRAHNSDRWFYLAIGVTGLFAAGAIRLGASRKT
jgi:hypothetical protein